MATPAAILSILVQAKGIATTKAQLEKLNRSSDDTSRSVDQMASKFRGVNGALGDFNRSMSATSNTIKIVKFPALIAGAGAAAQGVGALAAGATALGSALAPLAGGAAALGVAYTAMGQAAGVAKLATSGLEGAINGQKGAMDNLSPIQRDFVKQIRGLRKETQDLRGDAQRGLLPGLSEALRNITPLFQTLRPVVRATAEVMGNLAVRASSVVATWRGDMLTLGKANVTIIGNLGKAAILGANALRNLIVAAAPLATWLSKLAVQGAIWVDTQVAAARASGSLAKFLGETRSVMATLGGAIGNLVVGFVNIGKAAFPLGKGLLQDFKDLTARFREWTESATGRNTLAEYFTAARGPIYALFGLLEDVGAALLRLSAPTSLTTDLINQMRTLVPIFEQVIANTTAALGPALIVAIGNIARLVGVFAGASGPLTLYVQLIGALAGAFATLLESTPGLSYMVVTTLGFVSVAKIFGPMAAAIYGTAAAYRAMAAGATFAEVAQKRSTATAIAARVAMLAVAAATRVWTAVQWALNVALRANPIGLVITGLVALGTALVVAYRQSQTFRNIVNGAWAAVRSAATAAFNAIVTALRTAWNTITSIWKAIGPTLSGIIRGAIGMVTSAGKALGQGVISGFKAAFDLAATIITAVRNVIGQAASWGIGVGRKLVEGIKDGIKAAFGGVGSLVGDLVGKIGVGDAGRNIAGSIPGGAVRGGGGGKTGGLSPAARAGLSFINSKFGGVNVSSGFRTPEENRRVGGAPNSDHLTGNALDLTPAAGWSAAGVALMDRIAAWAKTNPAVRWIGWRGTPGHGPGDHLHLSFASGGKQMGDVTGSTRGRIAGAAKAARPKAGKGSGAAEQIFRFFRSKGFTPAQAAAWVGNFMQESGLSTTVVNPRSGATGLAQWLGGRLTGLKKKENWQSLQTQLNYVWEELQGPESAAYSAIKAAKGLEPATNAIAFKYERMGAHEAAMDARLSGARGVYNRFKGLSGKGTAPKTGATGTSGTGTTPEKVTPYQKKLAAADLLIAENTGEESGTGLQGYARQRAAFALSAKRKVVGAEIKRIRKALKTSKKMRPAKRLELTQRLATLVGEHTQLGQQGKELRHPAAVDTGLSAGGDLGGGGGDGGDPNQALIDSNAALQAKIEEQIAADKAHTDAIKALKEEITKQNAIAGSTIGIGLREAQRALADMISGQIGGYGGVAGRAFTAGAGSVVRY